MRRESDYLDLMRRIEFDVKASDGLDLATQRSEHEAGMALLPSTPVTNETDLSVAGMPARLYRPHPSHPAPGLIFFHGGGFRLGSSRSYQPIVRPMATDTGCVIVSIDYPLAPEHRFPAAIDHAYAATVEVAARAAELGIDPTRLGVGGDSSGANLAAVTALRCRDRGGPSLAAQILIYGVYDLADEPPPIIDPDGIDLEDGSWPETVERYLGGAAATLPYASPMRATDHRGLPLALILTAEFDKLSVQGNAYADVLRCADVPVTVFDAQGLDHAFLAWTSFARQPRDAARQLHAAIRATIDAPRRGEGGTGPSVTQCAKR
jgi:acetyl esterase